MLTFISGPYTYNPEEAVQRAALISSFLQEQNPTWEIFTPHLYDDWEPSTYTGIMLQCINRIARADQVVVIGPREWSKGSRAEIAFARACNIPVLGFDRLWIEEDLVSCYHELKHL